MVDMFKNLFTVLNTINTVATTVNKLAPNDKPNTNQVEVVERPVVVPASVPQQNIPPVNINLTINVYKDSDLDKLALPVLSRDDNGVTLNLK